MARRPAWSSKISRLIEDLQHSEAPYITTAILSNLLGVTQRRVQQIMRPLMSEKIGVTSVIERKRLITLLEKQLEVGAPLYYEERRQRRVSSAIAHLRVTPSLLVEAPIETVNSRLEHLPGVTLSPGKIVIEGFTTETEVLEKLLALALAIQNDDLRFPQMVGVAV